MLTIITVLNFDSILTTFLQKFVSHSLFFDYFFSFFSLKGSSILIWVLVIIGVTIIEERKNPGISKRDKQFIFLFSISFLITFLFADIVLKNIFVRPRPTFAEASVGGPFLTIYNHFQLFSTFSCPKDFSFPSAHAATAFAAATALTFFDKKRRGFYYLIAILISYSRIYLGCHYFFDVLFGGLLGLLISKILLKLFNSLIR